MKINAANLTESDVLHVFSDIPFGVPTEPTPKGGNGASRAFSVERYGLDEWDKLYTKRQLVALGTYLKLINGAYDQMKEYSYSEDWLDGISAYLVLSFDRLVSFNCSIVQLEGRCRISN